MANKSDKYQADDPLFDAENGILRNKLGLTDEAKLEHAENQALIRAYDQAALSYSEDHAFTSKDVCNLHRLFLGDIFEWAGEYRTVDISSPDIRWCHAKHIEKNMAEFDELLGISTPFSQEWPREEVLEKLAKIHGEFVVIHPFRDGNGRTGRLLGDLLLMQAEMSPIDFSALDDKDVREEYYAAIRQVWGKKEYERLTRLFDRLVPKG